MAPNLATGHEEFRPEVLEGNKEFEQSQQLLPTGGGIVIFGSTASRTAIPEALSPFCATTKKGLEAPKNQVQALLQANLERAGSFKREGKIYPKTGQLKWISMGSQPLQGSSPSFPVFVAPIGWPGKPVLRV